MLDSAGDTERDVEFRCDYFPSLPDLKCVWSDAGVYQRARTARGCVKFVGQSADETLEIVAALDGAAARDDDARLGDIWAGREFGLQTFVLSFLRQGCLINFHRGNSGTFVARAGGGVGRWTNCDNLRLTTNRDGGDDC